MTNCWNCPVCQKLLTQVVRRYPCSMVCYGYSWSDDGGHSALYGDMDCTNPECPMEGTVYSCAGGLSFGSCYLCGKLIGVFEDRLEGFTAVQAWAAVKVPWRPGERLYYHLDCQERGCWAR